jgi:hypothetical protein
MKLNWIIFFLMLYSCKEIKEYPDKFTIKQIAERILQKEYDSKIIVDSTKNIKFIKGHFTNQDKEECLAILPSINPWGRVNINPILLFEKIKDTWTYANWCYLQADSVSIIDIDNDKIQEILLYFTTMGAGRFVEDFALISLKNNQEKTLYENESIDESMERDPIAWADNDTISVKYEIQFIDRDKDGKKEIIEKKIIGFRDKVINDSLVEKFVQQTNVIKLK